MHLQVTAGDELQKELQRALILIAIKHVSIKHFLDILLGLFSYLSNSA